MTDKAKKQKIKYNYLTGALSIAVVVFMLSCAWMTTIVIAMSVPSTGITDNSASLIVLSPSNAASEEALRRAAVQFASLRRLEAADDADVTTGENVEPDVETDLLIVTDNRKYNDSNPDSGRWKQVASLPLPIFDNNRVPVSVNPNPEADPYANKLVAPFSEMSDDAGGAYIFSITIGNDIRTVMYNFTAKGLFDIEGVAVPSNIEGEESGAETTDEPQTDEPDNSPAANTETTSSVGEYFKEYPELYKLFTEYEDGVTKFEK